jgi:GTPase SAR1 family protein
MTQSPLNSFKIIVLGDSGVGKTSIAERYCFGIESSAETTIGISFQKK